ncbi:PIG-L family deacetylase [Kineococcus sp. TBRC 1896]|uniref:PIG-L family deacetylase n=1 Tax=Kineococcus mangrovi TaxID=1660183 RepID=A0ABV4I0F3_9ACTN
MTPGTTPGTTPGEDPAFTHDGPGTAETQWQRWPGLRDVAELDWSGTGHVLVVAAHPDDETLGAGGLIATAAARGLAVDVVVATDGEGSHPRSPTTTPQALAEVRAREVHDAVRALAPDARVHRLALPDGGVTAAVGTLAATVRALAGATTLLVAPWTADGHPDHDAAGAVAVQVAGETGATCLLYPVWLWHWAHPGDVRVPWQRGTRLELDGSARRRKGVAMARHASQTTPLSARPGDEVLLPAGVLAHFERAVEFFLRPGAAASTGSLGAGFFDDFYAAHGADPWGFEDRWYEARKRALTLAVLPRQQFRDGLEIGCSTGVLTVELARRTERLLAVDVAAQALERARERLLGAGVGEGVSTRVARVPQEFPDGTFDLVVLSEVAYYCDPDDLRVLLARLRGCLTPDGVLVACHWRHLVQGYPLTGDEVHRALRGVPGLDVLVRHEEEDFLLDVLVPAPAVSVARAGGLA